jgi:type I restriction enzyme M protein
MQLARAAKTSDRFGRYYTDADVAGLLVASMAAAGPGLVIDLGAGDGALVGAASRQWLDARFVTVDIDAGVGRPKLYGKLRAATHHIGDALEDNLAQRIRVSLGSVDSALCNPPYVRPRWRKHFAEMLEDAGLSSVIPKIGCVPADVLFIAQNLRFLRSGGKLGLILPDGVIAGEKFGKLRQLLATAHRLERVIELPRSVFRSTDAKAHIVVLTKHESPRPSIQVQRLEDGGALSASISLSTERAIERLDYSYLASAARRYDKRGLQLRDVAILLTRGPYSSADRRSCPHPVFHTTDFAPGSLEVPRDFVMGKSAADKIAGNVAEAGDILLARVGRNLEEKVCYVNRGVVAFSDCIFLLRIKEPFRQRVLRSLNSPRGRQALFAMSHGVGARFITTEALLSLAI